MPLVLNLLSVILFLLDHGLTGVYSDRVSVSVMEGDSVTLHSGIEREPQEDIKWYFNNSLIAKINGDLSDVCTDVQCHKGAERFRGRLKLDLQTGSLTIMNTRSTDTGDYQILINRSGEKIFRVTVHTDPAADGDEVKKNKGDSVTFNSGVIRTPNDVMSWQFNGTVIAEITGHHSQICTDDQCKERFSDRLKLDHQTGSLTITNIRSTDFGNYTLEIISTDKHFHFSRKKRFSVSGTSLPHSGLSAGAVAAAGAAAVVVVCLLLLGTVVIYRHRSGNRRQAAQNGNDAAGPNEMEMTCSH